MDYTNTYLDTRGSQATGPWPTFTEVIVKGIADGGGLFVPRVLPRFACEELASLASLPYAALATEAYRRFGVDLPAQTVSSLMSAAYGRQFDDEAIAPVRTIDARTHVLELWHGPTSAFKDMALQCLPLFFSEALAGQSCQGGQAGQSGQGPGHLILVATSGDTGTAALNGFADREHISIVVFYPHGGVSDIQYRQMATQRGNNVAVFGVRGNFDDCQAAVKRAFADAAFNEELLRRHSLSLSSANSINWGRLLPQVVYYLSAYLQLLANGSVRAGDPIDVCVPTGNFGNILAGYYAKMIGVPIDRLLCASNENRVLADFINTGTYSIVNRPFVLTPSPSMDILVSSNLERQLFELSGRDAALIRDWMGELAQTRRFSVGKDVFAALREHFSADWVSSNDSLLTIRNVFEAHGYLIDPHTAVGWEVAERLRGDNPVVIVSTAHWAKFGADVYRALKGLPAGSPLPAEAAGKSGAELNAHMGRAFGACDVPTRLRGIDEQHVRFTEVVDADTASLEAAVTGWLATRR
ncbi:MAG: threonine synthase [Coriobacteriales bacterium]|jgi:threonine synthase|nr:threonine synthase [Coriobacteriales bacterium]